MKAEPKVVVLDADGRANLAPGDIVLCKMKVFGVDHDDDTIQLGFEGQTTSPTWQHNDNYHDPVVYARLEPAFKVGDKVTVAPAHETVVEVIAIRGRFAWLGLEPGSLSGSIQNVDDLKVVS